MMRPLLELFLLREKVFFSSTYCADQSSGSIETAQWSNFSNYIFAERFFANVALFISSINSAREKEGLLKSQSIVVTSIHAGI